MRVQERERERERERASEPMIGVVMYKHTYMHPYTPAQKGYFSLYVYTFYARMCRERHTPRESRVERDCTWSHGYLRNNKSV